MIRWIHSYRWDLAVAAVLTIGTVAAYAPVLNADFVRLDDEDYASKNENVRAGLTSHTLTWAFQSLEAANWHPLTWLSLALDSQLFGPGPWGHHSTNLLLHCLNSLLLFTWWRAVTGAIWPSGLVAALFAWHPLHAESVAWISERKDVLSAFFWLTTMWTYLAYVKQAGIARYVWVVIAFSLGLLSKPMLVTLPLVLILLDAWPLGRWSIGPPWQAPRWHLLKEKLPLLALSLFACVATIAAQQAAVVDFESVPVWVRIANAILNYGSYLWKALLPINLAVFYPYPNPYTARFAAEVAISLCALIALTWLAWINRSSRPFLLIGWLWYLGTLVPVIGIIQVGSQAMADRYTYIPLIGIFVMTAWEAREIVASRPAWRSTLAVVATLGLTGCLLGTWMQTGYWQNNLDLWERAEHATTNNWMAECHYGMALVDAGQEQQGYERLQSAIALKPDLWQARHALGLLLARRGEYRPAANQFEQALALTQKRGNKPDARLLNDAGNAYLHSGRPDLAEKHYALAMKIEPRIEKLEASWGQALLQLGRLAEAEQHLKAALGQEGDSADLLSNYALDLKLQGRLTEAGAAYRRALRLQPDHLESLTNYAVLLAQQGVLDQAENLLRRAWAGHAADGETAYNLAVVLEARHQSKEALNLFERAVELAPRQALYRLRLATALEKEGRIDAARRQMQAAKELGWKPSR